MSNYRRMRAKGASYFFTVTTAGRGPGPLVDRVDALRDAVARTRAERPFLIDAMVVLPDHVHAVWTLPEGDADYSTRWGAIKARFTRRVGLQPTGGAGDDGTGVVGWKPTLRSMSKRRKQDGKVWQRRFWEHCIRDDADYRAHVAYCWLDPVKHGYVERPVDWLHSSIHRDIRRGLVGPDYMGRVHAYGVGWGSTPPMGEKRGAVGWNGG